LPHLLPAGDSRALPELYFSVLLGAGPSSCDADRVSEALLPTQASHHAIASLGCLWRQQLHHTPSQRFSCYVFRPGSVAQSAA